MENKENTVAEIGNNTNINEKLNSESSENEIKKSFTTKNLPFYFKWWFIFVMYVLFFYFPVVPIALNIGRLLFNKKYPYYKNKGGRKTVIAIIAYMLVVITVAIIITSIDTKRYNEVTDTIKSGNYEQALVMLNENYSDLNNQEDVSLWYYYYCETKEYNSAAELYLDLIEKSTDILTCKNNIEKIENIKNKLNEENKARFKNIKASYTEALKQAETTAVITTKKETENTTVTSQNVDDKEKTTKENKVTEEKTNETTITTKKEDVSNSKENSEFIKQWIDENISEEEVKERKAKKLKKVVDEDEFYIIWRELLYSEIKSQKEPDYLIMSDINNYCRLYANVWPGSSKNIKLLAYVEELEESIEISRDYRNKIGFDSNVKEIYTEDFYLTQKLEKDTISEILSELNVTENRNEWVAYDVKYSVFGNLPGDSVSVLSTPKNMTFPERGAYTLSYIKTGDTTTLVDSSGFSQEAPVYLVVSNAEEIESFILEKGIADSNSIYYLECIRSILKGEEVSEFENKDRINYKYKDSAPDWVFEDSLEIPYKVCTGGSILNIRAGCGQEYEIVGKLEDGCDIDVLGVYNGWAYIIGSYGINGFAEGGNYKEIYGWVSVDYLEIIPYSP